MLNAADFFAGICVRGNGVRRGVKLCVGEGTLLFTEEMFADSLDVDVVACHHLLYRRQKYAGELGGSDTEWRHLRRPYVNGVGTTMDDGLKGMRADGC